jgi:hypothetical protein
MEKWKFFDPPETRTPGSPLPVVQPVASRYTDWAIPAPNSSRVYMEISIQAIPRLAWCGIFGMGQWNLCNEMFSQVSDPGQQSSWHCHLALLRRPLGRSKNLSSLYVKLITPVGVFPSALTFTSKNMSLPQILLTYSSSCSLRLCGLCVRRIYLVVFI